MIVFDNPVEFIRLARFDEPHEPKNWNSFITNEVRRHMNNRVPPTLLGARENINNGKD